VFSYIIQLECWRAARLAFIREGGTPQDCDPRRGAGAPRAAWEEIMRDMSIDEYNAASKVRGVALRAFLSDDQFADVVHALEWIVLQPDADEKCTTPAELEKELQVRRKAIKRIAVRLLGYLPSDEEALRIASAASR
jgi:hypothetical protein